MSTVYVVYSMSTNYDGDENPCGDTFKLVGIFTDPDVERITYDNYRGADDCEWIKVELNKEVDLYF